MSRRGILKQTRKRLYREHAHNCCYCGIPLAHPDWPGTTITKQGFQYQAEGHRFVEIDHVVPLAQGGSNRYENLVLSCGPCNRRKGAA